MSPCRATAFPRTVEEDGPAGFGSKTRETLASAHQLSPTERGQAVKVVAIRSRRGAILHNVLAAAVVVAVMPTVA